MIKHPHCSASPEFSIQNKVRIVCKRCIFQQKNIGGLGHHIAQFTVSPSFFVLLRHHSWWEEKILFHGRHFAACHSTFLPLCCLSSTFLSIKGIQTQNKTKYISVDGCNFSGNPESFLLKSRMLCMLLSLYHSVVALLFPFGPVCELSVDKPLHSELQ